jgi:hypothetical protein
MVFIRPRNNTWEVKMRPVEFIIKKGDEHLTSHSGLALISTLMERMELGERINAVKLHRCREPRPPIAIPEARLKDSWSW